MAHKVDIVEIKELSDELVSYKCRCCDDPKTDSWHTVSVHAEDMEESLQAHMDAMAARHEKKHAWRAKHGIPKAGK